MLSTIGDLVGAPRGLLFRIVTALPVIFTNSTVVISQTPSLMQTGRPLVVWLDHDAGDDARKMQATLQHARAGVRDPAPVGLAMTPPEAEDPGSTPTTLIAGIVAAALAARATLRSLRPQELRR